MGSRFGRGTREGEGRGSVGKPRGTLAKQKKSRCSRKKSGDLFIFYFKGESLERYQGDA